MNLSRRRLAALLHKDLVELRAAPGVLIGPAAMVATAVAMPLAVAVGVPWWAGEPLDRASDLVALAHSWSGRVGAGVGDAALVQALLLHQFLPFLALVPVVTAMTLVTTSIVAEKQARTLEPLLATPLTTAELLLAKAGAALTVALGALVLGTVLLLAAVVTLALPGVGRLLLSPHAAALVLAAAPAATLVALALGVIVSSRARDARAAQQAGVVVVVPIVAVFVAQLNGVLILDAPRLAVAALVLLALAAGLGAIAVRVFDRERILTRWT